MSFQPGGRAPELRHLPALVVQLLPVEAAHQVALDEHPEVSHLRHLCLLLKKLVDPGPTQMSCKENQPNQPEKVEVRGVLAEGHVDNDKEEDAIDDELSEGGLHEELLVAVLVQHLPGRPHSPDHPGQDALVGVSRWGGWVRKGD